MHLKTFYLVSLTFCLTFPAIIAKGDSQFPLWLFAVVSYALLMLHRVSVARSYIVLTLLIFTFLLLSVFFNQNGVHVASYRLQILLSFALAAFLTVDFSERSILTALTFASTLNILAIFLEVFFPQFCDFMGLFNKVRGCIAGRPSGFYSEPSHIAFLSLLFFFLLWRTRSLGLNLRTFICVLLSILSVSGTLIGGLFLWFSYSVFRRVSRSSLASIYFSSLAYVSVNLLYLYLRNVSLLPIQGSYDKRASYTTMFLNIERLFPDLTVWPTNEIFYSVVLYPRVMYNNHEILGGYASIVPASLSPISSIIIVLGWPLCILLCAFFHNALKGKRYPEIFLLFWLGLPAALSAVPIIFILLKKKGWNR